MLSWPASGVGCPQIVAHLVQDHVYERLRACWRVEHCERKLHTFACCVMQQAALQMPIKDGVATCASSSQRGDRSSDLVPGRSVLL